MARSGTNFLAHLLRLHPDCKGTYPEFEDYFMPQAHHLFGYAQAVQNHWSWGLSGKERDQLIQCLSQGLVAFLGQHLGASRVVTKTPSVRGLPLFFRLFPDACLIVLIRDGRAVVESMMNTFNEPFESCVQDWARAADTVLVQHQEFERSGARYLLVRYEDLVRDVQAQMRGVLTIAELPLDTYDFEAASHAPVIGSSSIKNTDGRVMWKPQPKPQGFDPLKRAEHWSNRQHARFNWIAGKQSAALGYPCRAPGGSQIFWWIYNVVTDVMEGIVRAWRKIRTRAKRVERRHRLRAFKEGKVSLS